MCLTVRKLRRAAQLVCAALSTRAAVKCADNSDSKRGVQVRGADLHTLKDGAGKYGG